MLRHIDAQNGIPIYEQIIRQVTIAVAEMGLESELIPIDIGKLGSIDMLDQAAADQDKAA